MTLRFGDLLSNALHDIKQQTGKKISILQDEIGFAFDPALSGDTIEKWRYRKPTLSTSQLSILAETIIKYGHPNHSRGWLHEFLEKGGDAYPEVTCERLFPSKTTPVADRPSSSTLEGTPPITAYSPPTRSLFVGRSQELAHHQSQLQSDKLTAICGMAGIGKTSLATEIAYVVETNYDAVFWHRFYDQNLNTLIRRLAGFLTHFGRSELWEMIEAARLSGVRPPDVTTSFDTLVAQLSDLNILLCFDDLQFADKSQELTAFLGRLIDQSGAKLPLAQSIPSILITSRRFPTFLPAGLRGELSGLSLIDTVQLLESRRITLADDLAKILHNVTEGNGAFLTLATVVLNGVPDPADLIERLATIEDIERFLLEEVNDRLSGQEQRVMEGVAILSGYSGTRDVLEVMLNQRDVRRTLRMLADQYLLTTTEGEHGREFSQHQIVQAFYYDQPTRQKKRDLHRSAADFYEWEEVDRFKAVLHYTKAGEADRAVQLTALHLWEIVNQGMAASLLPILESIKAEGLSENERFELWLAQGQLDSLLGDYDNGRERFELAAQKLQELPVNERTNQLKGRVCLYMAELLERQEPPKAMEWGQRGLDILAGEKSELAAELKLIVGAIMMNMGNTGGALEQILDCQADLPEGNLALQANIDKNLGAIYWLLGDLTLALEHSTRALETSKKRRDHLQTARIYTNLGPIKYTLEDWGGAISDLENALVIATKLGSYQFMMGLHINLGRVYFHSGIDEKTLEHLNTGLAMAEKIKSGASVLAKINLAKHYLRDIQSEKALQLLAEAEDQAKNDNDQLSLATIHIIQADAFLAQENLEETRNKIEYGLHEAQLIGDKHEQGVGWRTKGKLELAEGNLSKANEAFDKSINFLASIDRFQFALTKLEIGKSLLQNAAVDEGILAINHALEIFVTLGASKEQQKTNHILLEYQSLR